MGYAQVAFGNHRFVAFTSSDNYSAVLDMTPPTTTTTPVTLPHTGTHPQALLELGGALCAAGALVLVIRRQNSEADSADN
jgi:LPXTG-motif cell wall-anchored protein